MSAATENIEHGERTQRSRFRYLFTAKHHGGDKSAAKWLACISRDEEFSIFDLADLHEIADERQWLYGVLRGSNGELNEIGTMEEQVAEFQPGQSSEDPWHGYPKWPIKKKGPGNRRKQRPDRIVFDRMVVVGLIDKIQRKNLLIGREA